MVDFKDVFGKSVVLSFVEESFAKEAQHVLVCCETTEGWVLTKHKQRGWEFPGGKKEQGETLIDAATRETYEETGAILSDLVKIGEYCVYEKEYSFVKAVFWGKVQQIVRKENYHETEGPVIVSKDLLTSRFEDHYSFIMKDEVVAACLERIAQLKEKREC